MTELTALSTPATRYTTVSSSCRRSTTVTQRSLNGHPMQRSLNVTHNSTAVTQRLLNFVDCTSHPMSRKGHLGTSITGKGRGHRRLSTSDTTKTKNTTDIQNIYTHQVLCSHRPKPHSNSNLRRKADNNHTALMRGEWPQDVKIPLCTCTRCRPSREHYMGRLEGSSTGCANVPLLGC